MINIAVLGPESTGKSTLCKALSEHFEISYTNEYARTYLNQIGRNYKYDDLISIAKGQEKLINEGLGNAKELFISDTEIITIKVWSEVKYGTSDLEINDMIDDQNFNLYLLCSADLPWEYDSLRETPELNKRKKIFKLFKFFLELHNCDYEVVSGKNEERTKMAIKHINSILDR